MESNKKAKNLKILTREVDTENIDPYGYDVTLNP